MLIIYFLNTPYLERGNKKIYTNKKYLKRNIVEQMKTALVILMRRFKGLLNGVKNSDQNNRKNILIKPDKFLKQVLHNCSFYQLQVQHVLIKELSVIGQMLAYLGQCYSVSKNYPNGKFMIKNQRKASYYARRRLGFFIINFWQIKNKAIPANASKASVFSMPFAPQRAYAHPSINITK
jgi:hypothetical protein